MPADRPPAEGPDASRLRHAPSLVLVHTGDGKGKTSAAMGVVVRALARGWRVLVVQFIKSGEWRAGEHEVLGGLGVDWYIGGDGFTWDSNDLDRSAELAADAWAHARDAIVAGTHELVVMDEITYAMSWGWIDTAEVVRTITERPPNVSIVATGRDAPAALVDAADTVTEMTNVKHAFDAGVAAKRGIDY
ncbi:MAG: cob(I)yrinic acid a,c-diamide adenosyltransferase [Ilumatobacteraceae bacterium]